MFYYSFGADATYSSEGKDLAAYHPSPAVRVKAATSLRTLLKRLPAQRAISLLNLVRGTGVVWKSYYYAGSSRIAMREESDSGTEVYYILTDHLGSTSLTYRTSDGLTAAQKYKPWGEPRQVSGVLPTDRTFQGRRDSGWGLAHFGARWFDSALGRFAQADTVVPGAGNPLGWDRYAGLGNNPVRYTDPSGHMVAEGDDSGCDSNCWDRTRQNYLFSLVFTGSGKDGKWTGEDWHYYYENRTKLYGNPTTWKNPDSEVGWDLFALHVERLASHYSDAEKGQFVEDFTLLFSGISREKSWPLAALEVARGPRGLSFLNYGNEGLDPQYEDTKNPGDNQSHHYVGIFFLSYHVDPEIAMVVNYGRDYDNQGDILLGDRAAYQAYYYRFYTNGPSSIPRLILNLRSP